MYISLNWLKDFVDIPKDLDPKTLGNELTLKTAEIEKVENLKNRLDKTLTGKLVSFKKIEGTKHYHKGTVDIGDKQITLVFGAVFKLEEGWILPIALEGARLPGGEIQKTEIHGVTSEGMICTDNELGIQNSETGLTVFPKDTPLGKPLAEVLKIDNDIVLEVDNKALTHRPDLWGHYGMAREVAAITQTKFKPIEPKVKLPTSGESVKVDIKNFDLCPRYCGLIINNIKVEESPDWLKKRLKATEHGTHNNIVDITNYVMAELGQPMHAFDKNYIKEGIIVRQAKKGEKITSLDNKERKLESNMLVIADHEKPVAIAGVIGGENSEINKETTSIILESANFNASSIRKTSTKLGIRTDAVQRFEKALDPNLAELAIKRAAELILELCPQASIGGPTTDIKKFSTKPLKIDLTISKTLSKIGVDIPKKDIKHILENLEFKIKEKDKDTFTVTVPSFRSTKDVENEDDIIEEVARMYGYENIPASLPALPTKLPTENTERFKKHKIREIFSYGLGFDEVYNYSFYGKQEMTRCQINEEGHIKLLNYLSEDQTHLRTSLIPNLLKNIQLNIKHFENFKLYEIGRTYKEIGQYMPLEEKKVSGAIVKKEKTDKIFYEATGTIEELITRFNIKGIKTAEESENTPYAHPNKSITYISPSGQTIAQVFMVHPNVINNHDLDSHSIAMFEINFTEIMKLEHITKKYEKLQKFPTIKIDISVVIDRETTIKTLKDSIQKADKKLITKIDLFDIYEGEGIEKNKKAVAFAINLQAQDRTLTDKEMTTIQNQIFQNLENLGGKIRGK